VSGCAREDSGGPKISTEDVTKLMKHEKGVSLIPRFAVTRDNFQGKKGKNAKINLLELADIDC